MYRLPKPRCPQARLAQNSNFLQGSTVTTTARGPQEEALGCSFVLHEMGGSPVALVQLGDDLYLSKKSNFRHLLGFGDLYIDTQCVWGPNKTCFS